MKKFFSSLRVRIILVVILAALPALILTLYSGLDERQQAAINAQESMLRTARYAADQHEILIEDTRVLLLTMSHAFNLTEHELGNCGHVFSHLKDIHFPFYSSFYVADLEGNILCTMPTGDVPEDLATCTHYQNLIASEDFVISEYHICRNTGKGVISMGYPVWNVNNQKVGVINIGIDLALFNDFAANANLPEGSTLTVIDKTGVVLAHYPDPDSWVGKTLPENSIYQEITSQRSGTTEFTGEDGISRLHAFLPLSGTDDHVFIDVGTPKDVAYAEINRALVRNLIWIGVASILAVIAAWFLGNYLIMQSIEKLVDTTQEISNGNLNARTNMTYDRSEFGMLANSVDTMAVSLSQREQERDQAEATMQEYAADLERSNRDLMDFTNIASHDLQEPLRKIQSFSDILRIRHTQELSTEAQDYVKRIQSAASRMQNLVIALLDYSRISTKSQPIEKVNLTQIARKAAEDLDLAIEESQATLTIQPIPNISADPFQMQHLFLNLISNAIKFRQPNMPLEVNISGQIIQNGSPTNAHLNGTICEISVSDNGIGFDAKYSDRIFQPFERLHDPNQYDGTGMGLAICRKIVERHHGTITAQSTPGKGTTFIIHLPIQQPGD